MEIYREISFDEEWNSVLSHTQLVKFRGHFSHHFNLLKVKNSIDVESEDHYNKKESTPWAIDSTSIFYMTMPCHTTKSVLCRLMLAEYM